MTTMERTCREVERVGNQGLMEANFLNQLIKKGYKEVTFQQRSGMSGKIYLVSGCFPEFSVRNNILMASL